MISTRDRSSAVQDLRRKTQALQSCCWRAGDLGLRCPGSAALTTSGCSESSGTAGRQHSSDILSLNVGTRGWGTWDHLLNPLSSRKDELGPSTCWNCRGPLLPARPPGAPSDARCQSLPSIFQSFRANTRRVFSSRVLQPQHALRCSQCIAGGRGWPALAWRTARHTIASATESWCGARRPIAHRGSRASHFSQARTHSDSGLCVHRAPHSLMVFSTHSNYAS